MYAPKKPTPRVASPEWLTAQRADRAVDSRVPGGWGAVLTPLLRGAAYTDFGNHTIAVPEGDTPDAIAVRIHELTHARISPTSVPSELLAQLGVSPEAVRVAEEVRVNMVARLTARYAEYEAGRNPVKEPEAEFLAHAKDLADGTEKAVADRAVVNDDWRSAVTLFLGTLNTDVHKLVKRRLRRNEKWREPLSRLERFLKNERFLLTNKSFSRMWHVTSHRDMMSNTEPMMFRWADRRTGRVTNTLLPAGFVNFTLPIAQVIDSLLGRPPVDPNKKPHHDPEGDPKGDPNEQLPDVYRPDKYGDGVVGWEALRFGITNLTETTTAFLGKRKRPSSTGKHPSRPDRLLTDPERRVFRSVVRSRGGVVVFDCSGSMSVTHDEVHAVVRQFAGATVVAYTHNDRIEANAWVLAHNGRMISRDDFDRIPLGHGNGVDGPILDWAVRNRRNSKDFIVWVSDGHVTGRNDGQNNSQLRYVAALSVKNNIIGCEDAEEAIALLADMKRTGGTPRHRFVEKTEQTLRQMGYGNASSSSTRRRRIL